MHILGHERELFHNEAYAFVKPDHYVLPLVKRHFAAVTAYKFGAAHAHFIVGKGISDPNFALVIVRRNSDNAYADDNTVGK